MNRVKKWLSYLLVVVLVINIMSCSKKVNHEQVTEDTIWYEPSYSLLYDGVYDEEVYDWFDKSLLGYRDGEFLLETSAQSVYTNYEEMERYRLLSLVDSSGNIIVEKDLTPTLDICSEEYGASMFRDYVLESFEEDYITIWVLALNNSYEDLNFKMVLDATTLEEVSLELLREGPFQDGFNKFLKHGDYCIYQMSTFRNGSYEIDMLITVMDSSGNIESVNINANFPNQVIDTCLDIVPINETNVLIICREYPYDTFNLDAIDLSGRVAYQLNLETMELSESSYTLPFISYELVDKESFYSEEYGSIIVGDGFIGSFDEVTGEAIPLVSLENTNINRNKLDKCSVVSYSPEEILLSCDCYDPSSGCYRLELITLTKAETNPNAGETILKIAALGKPSLSDSVCEAIVDFNNASDKAFIVFDDRYLIDYSDYASEDSIMNPDSIAFTYNFTEINNKIADLNNQLQIDLISGIGPDIVINAFNNTSLNNSDLFMDLSENVPSNANDHIIELSKTEGKLYHMPLSYELIGIKVMTETLSEGQIGFTYDEYVNYVSTVTNGVSLFRELYPLDILEVEINAMTDLFIDENGNTSFDNESFRNLVEFIKNNTYEPTMPYEYFYMLENEAWFETYDEPYDFVSGWPAEPTTLIGLPSEERRGPTVRIVDSVAIASYCPLEEEAKSFLNSLTSDDSQILIEPEIPISDAILDIKLDEQIEISNKQTEEADLQELGFPLLDESDKKDAMRIINSASSVVRINPSCLRVIIEEIPGYLEGQKTYDEIMIIVNDRIATIGEERQ